MVCTLLHQPGGCPQDFDCVKHDGGYHYLAVEAALVIFVGNDGYALPLGRYAGHAHAPADNDVLAVGGRNRNMGRHPDTANQFHDPVQGRTVNAGVAVGRPQILVGRGPDNHRQVARHAGVPAINLVPYEVVQVALEGVIGGLVVVGQVRSRQQRVVDDFLVQPVRQPVRQVLA